MAVEWKAWLTLPGVGPVTAVDVGADGTFVLSAGFDSELGPIDLFTVSPAHARGVWGWDCRFLDPTTGETLWLDLNPFEVE